MGRRTFHFQNRKDNNVESLTGPLLPAETVEQAIRESVDFKSSKVYERVSLGKIESAKLTNWIGQLDSHSKGFVTLSKADFVNFLIREHRDELSNKEMNQIRSDHYDPIKHINWITPRLKEALLKNDLQQVALLQEEIRGIDISIMAHVKANIPCSAQGVDKKQTNSSSKKTKKQSAEKVVKAAANTDFQGQLKVDLST